MEVIKVQEIAINPIITDKALYDYNTTKVIPNDVIDTILSRCLDEVIVRIDPAILIDNIDSRSIQHKRLLFATSTLLGKMMFSTPEHKRLIQAMTIKAIDPYDKNKKLKRLINLHLLGAGNDLTDDQKKRLVEIDAHIDYTNKDDTLTLDVRNLPEYLQLSMLIDYISDLFTLMINEGIDIVDLAKRRNKGLIDAINTSLNVNNIDRFQSQTSSPILAPFVDMEIDRLFRFKRNADNSTILYEDLLYTMGYLTTILEDIVREGNKKESLEVFTARLNYVTYRILILVASGEIGRLFKRGTDIRKLTAICAMLLYKLVCDVPLTNPYYCSMLLDMATAYYTLNEYVTNRATIESAYKSMLTECLPITESLIYKKVSIGTIKQYYRTMYEKNIAKTYFPQELIDASVSYLKEGMATGIGTLLSMGRNDAVKYEIADALAIMMLTIPSTVVIPEPVRISTLSNNYNALAISKSNAIAIIRALREINRSGSFERIDTKAKFDAILSTMPNTKLNLTPTSNAERTLSTLKPVQLQSTINVSPEYQRQLLLFELEEIYKPTLTSAYTRPATMSLFSLYDFFKDTDVDFASLNDLIIGAMNNESAFNLELILRYAKIADFTIPVDYLLMQLVMMNKGSAHLNAIKAYSSTLETKGSTDDIDLIEYWKVNSASTRSMTIIKFIGEAIKNKSNRALLNLMLELRTLDDILSIIHIMYRIGTSNDSMLFVLKDSSMQKHLRYLITHTENSAIIMTKFITYILDEPNLNRDGFIYIDRYVMDVTTYKNRLYKDIMIVSGGKGFELTSLDTTKPYKTLKMLGITVT